MLSYKVLPAVCLWRAGTSARAAGDRECLLVPSDGVAVVENGLLDWAHGAGRGREHCWHKLFFHVHWLPPSLLSCGNPWFAVR